MATAASRRLNTILCNLAPSKHQTLTGVPLAASTDTSPLPNPFLHGYYTSAELRRFGFAAVGEDVHVARNCTIIGPQNIRLGSHVRIDAHVILAAGKGSLDIGNYVHIAAFAFVGCAGGVVLEDFAGLSQGVCLYSGSDDYTGLHLTNPTVPAQFLGVHVAPVHLSRHVIIGSHSVLLPGVTVGEGSSVGAQSLVNKSLAPWGVYAGSPAKKFKDRKKDLLELEKKLLELNK